MLCRKQILTVLSFIALATTVFANSSVQGDFDGDNYVDVNDLQIFADNWLSVYAPADLDGSGMVNFGDFAILANNWQKMPKMTINEIMAENNLCYADPQGEYNDWIEIYNATDSPVDLGGMYITDNLGDLTKYQIPVGYSAQTTVPAYGFIVLWADEDIDDGPLHLGFKLSSGGEEIALVEADGFTIVDSLEFTNQVADISFGSYPDGSLVRRYFGYPTPGSANNEGYFGIAPTPAFSKKSGIFFDDFSAEITVDSNEAVIRYTTDHTIPTLESEVYTGPIDVNATTEIMARAFMPGYADSEVEGKNYVKVSEDIRNFNTNLPIVVVDSFGYYIDAENTPNEDYPYRNVFSIFIDTNDVGRATLTDDPDCQTRGGMKVRGQTTASYMKKQYKFESWDNMDDDKDVSIFGMPSESDWIIHSPVTDGSYMRNYMTYKLYRAMGNYAVRTRFCELFNNQNNGEVTYDDYAGIYVMMEKIKVGDDRLESEKLEASDNAEPEISGGYVIKQDKGATSSNSFVTSTYHRQFQYAYPNEFALTTPQKLWIQQYCNALEVALACENFDDPVNGYMKYLDVPTFVDYHLMVEISKNVDGYGLSDYMFKPRNGILRKEAVWDYNWAWGNAYYNDCQYPERWHYVLTWDYSGYRWYRRLFEDVNFELAYLDRWFKLRKGLFSTDTMWNKIDSYAAKLNEAQPRDYARWGTTGSYDTPLNYLKNWIRDRMAWIDTQFRNPPVYNYDGGLIDPAFELTMTHDEPPYILNYADYNDSWSYLDGGVTPTDSWTGLGYGSGDTWPTGYGPFGFGDGDENTVIDYGSDPDNKPITTYFRKEFTVEDPNMVAQLTLKLQRDAGAIVWLNGGDEIILDNMSVRHKETTPALSEVEGEDENTYYVYDIDPNLLLMGDNVIGIEVHLSSIDDDDMSFDAQLQAIIGYATEAGTLYYTTDGSDPRLHGGALSPTANEYTGPISFDKTTKVIAREFDGNWTARNEAVFQIGPVNDSLRITEIMYHSADPNAEYIELQNIGSETLNLNLVSFTDGIDFTFGDYDLLPGEYVLVVEDIAAFTAKYGSGYPIAGEYLGSLDNGGEEIVLRDAFENEIHDFDYKDGWYDITDGDGFSLVIIDATVADVNAWDEKEYWRASAAAGGSPGEGDVYTVPVDGAIVINEVMTNPITGQCDWIELHNTTAEAINIGGWFLSDQDNSDVNSTKYEIATGTAIPANGYIVFYESMHFGNVADPGCNIPFGLSSKGDDVYLRSGEDGVITSYYETEGFDAAATGVTFGRYQKSTGTFNFVAMVSATAGTANSAPVVGPIVINEIMYNPPQGSDAEYIELYNTSSSPVALQSYDSELYTNVGWQFNEGIEYIFPLGTIIPAHGYAVIARDISTFNATYGSLPAGALLLGPFVDGKLDNGGEKVQLSIPVGSDPDYIEKDRISYDDESPWPTSPDGSGHSLSRISPTAYGNDPVNWTGSNPTPGASN